jgi:hypothetical protein
MFRRAPGAVQNVKQSQMNSGYCLPKDRHDGGVGCISAWKLHVVGERVWRNTLQNELTGISVFAFVALERNSKKSNSDGNREAKNDYGQNPPPGTQRLAALVDLMSHESCYSDEKREVATRVFEIRASPQIPTVSRLHQGPAR